MSKCIIFNGYTEIGQADSYDEAKKQCEAYCDRYNVSFELKRELFSPGVTVLVFQYKTLYFETFVITQSYEIEAFIKELDEELI